MLVHIFQIVLLIIIMHDILTSDSFHENLSLHVPGLLAWHFISMPLVLGFILYRVYTYFCHRINGLQAFCHRWKIIIYLYNPIPYPKICPSTRCLPYTSHVTLPGLPRHSSRPPAYFLVLWDQKYYDSKRNYWFIYFTSRY